MDVMVKLSLNRDDMTNKVLLNSLLDGLRSLYLNQKICLNLGNVNKNTQGYCFYLEHHHCPHCLPWKLFVCLQRTFCEVPRCHTDSSRMDLVYSGKLETLSVPFWAAHYRSCSWDWRPSILALVVDILIL